MSAGSGTRSEPPIPLDLRRDGREPVFAAPWQAQAFALVLLLHRQGRFTWQRWVEVLSTAIDEAPGRTGESAVDAYHRQWLSALERISVEVGLTDPVELDERTEAWRRAYRGTPHGRPVLLENAARAAGDEPPA